jgi:hypothetical protein
VRLNESIIINTNIKFDLNETEGRKAISYQLEIALNFLIETFGPVRVVSSAAGILLFLALANVGSAVDFTSIDDTNVVVTGIRSNSSVDDSVVITASYVTGGITYAGLYSGSLAAVATAPSSSWATLTPVFSGQTVSSATFYGPNTSVFNPSIGAGNVIAVGSYKYAEGSSGANADHGVIYQGSTAGGGTWLQIDATPLVTSGTLINTIAHSNMGNLVVGNYDTDSAVGNAFIYNMSTGIWTNLNPGGSASVTAYGIWQNGGDSSTSYTIAGGFSDVNSNGLDEGYIVNYDSVSGRLTNYKTFNYANQPVSALVSHFDGITLSEDGFNLTGDYLTLSGDAGGFFASVKVNLDGSFSDAVWTDINYPLALATSGNTVIDNTVLGIFVNGGTQSYLATVPEPSAMALMALGLGWLIIRRQRMLRVAALRY